ncbi:protein VAPYRIN-LIKE-like [Nymphaea colorata]|nr:protein VAPYRIN-LIKE-like [Nymphaea colorata]
MDRLVRTDVKELELLFKRGQQRCSAKFRVQNLMHTMAVAIDISTTNTAAFTIKPSSPAVIPPLSLAQFSIFTNNPSEDRPPLAFPQDKLFIRSSMLPTGKAEEEQLHCIFSQPGAHVYKDATLPISFTGEDTARAIIFGHHRLHHHDHGDDGRVSPLSSSSSPSSSSSFLLAKAVSVCTPSQKADLLRSAAQFGESDLVSALIDAGADVNCRDNHDLSPLYLAVLSGDAGSVRVLLSAGAAVDLSVGRFLHSAESLRRLDVLSAFVDSDLFDVNGAMDSLGRTPLHLSAVHGNVDALRLCISWGGDVDRVDLNGWTPLHCAAAEGHLGAVDFLLAVCNTKYAVTRDGKTAHMLAMESGHHHLMDALCLADKLHRAAGQDGNVHGVKEYVAQGASVDSRDQNGWTPLHRAAFKGRADVVQFLLDQGAQLDPLDNAGYTPLDCAAEAGHTHVAKLLICRGARRNSNDDNNQALKGSTCPVGFFSSVDRSSSLDEQ